MSNKHLLLFLSTILVISFFSGCSSNSISTSSSSQSIQLTDGADRLVSLSGPAQRVVSLAPAVTEILFAVGAGEQVVGRDSFSNYPDDAKALPDIGGGFGELNTEAIVAQEPDLVLASDLTPPEQLEALENLGLTVFSLPDPAGFPEMFESLRIVARLTGHEQQAETLVMTLEKRLQAVQASISKVTERPLVFYEIDGTDPNAPWTAGPGSFVDQLISLAGGQNLGASLGNEWAQISIEELIAQDPDLILIGDATWGGVTLEDVKSRTGWDSLSAIRTDQLFYFDDDLVSRPGPRLLDGLETMAKLFHPELFQ